MDFYADHNATSPVHPDHFDRVCERLKEVDGNPSSIHKRGRGAKVALEDARESVARLLGAEASEIVFTSGATESNNLAISGWLQSQITEHRYPHAVTSAVEHPSVLEPINVLAEQGRVTRTIIGVGNEGRITADDVLAGLLPETVLVAVMAANNEIGSINPIVEIAAAVKERRPDIHVHVDGVQVFGRLDTGHWASSPIDSIAVTAHKMGGFKGVGALYSRTGLKLDPLSVGGGQERKRRPGTENMPGIVSFGLRCEEVSKNMDRWVQRTQEQQRLCLRGLRDIPGCVIHGRPDQPGEVSGWLPNTINFHIDGIPGEDILVNFDLAGIQASSGSACSSGVGRPSHVLKAIGLSDWQALNSVRLSFGDPGDEQKRALADIQEMLKLLNGIVARQRSLLTT